jgi:hypothetical protein
MTESLEHKLVRLAKGQHVKAAKTITRNPTRHPAAPP